jgi:hypothetical protein
MNAKNDDTAMTDENSTSLKYPFPDWLNVQLAAYMNVYAHALGALLTWDDSRVTDCWLELRNGIGPRRTPSFIEQVEEIAGELAEHAEFVADGFLESRGIS